MSPSAVLLNITNRQNPSLNRTIGNFISKWRWKVVSNPASSSSSSSSISALFICISMTSLISMTLSHPLSSQSDCDWNGRGALSTASSIQTMTLRCTRGRVHWEDPKGGLRIHLTPPGPKPPFKLCLEDIRERGSVQHRILLEESSGRLLQVLSSEMKSSDCYEISEPSAVLYVESERGGVSPTDQVMPTASDSRPISLSYEVESLRGDGDPCRPCSEAETLKSYCLADVVARGSILQILPGSQYDSIYIKSDLVLHQNQPVFTKFKSPMINFLLTKASRFDLDKPQRVSSTRRGQVYQGIISHPSQCSASTGPGDFLWLIKFRFGMPLTDCVLYWEKWVELAKRGGGECPLSTGLGN